MLVIPDGEDIINTYICEFVQVLCLSKEAMLVVFRIVMVIVGCEEAFIYVTLSM